MPMNFQPCGSSFGRSVIDHRRLRRAVEIVLDLLDLGDLRQLGDVERAVLEGEPVRTMQARRDDLDLALAALVDEGMDLVLQAAADEHRSLVALAQRARVRHAAGIDLDIEALRQPSTCRQCPAACRRRSESAAARPARASSRLPRSVDPAPRRAAAWGRRRRRGSAARPAGHARSVAKVLASKIARRVEYPLVMWSSLTRKPSRSLACVLPPTSAAWPHRCQFPTFAIEAQSVPHRHPR